MVRRLRDAFRGMGKGGGGLGFVIPVVRFPVQVTPLFIVVAVVLAFSVTRRPSVFVLIALTLFFSILIHELGHAWLASRWGAVYRIVIHGFGGLTEWQAFRRLSVGQNLAVVLAGPAAGLGLALAAMAARALPIGYPWLVSAALYEMAWINVIWSLFNLLPVKPLDGGRALELVLCAWLRRGAFWTAVVGLVVAAIGCVAAVALRQLFVAVFLGALALSHLEQVKARRKPPTGWHSVDRGDLDRRWR
jgi:stage IV sporulation protein FB